MFDITKYLRDNLRCDPLNIQRLLREAEKVVIQDMDHYRDKFIIEQAEIKLKYSNDGLIQEQKDALNWAQGVLEKTEPHAKQDILKFKDKIEGIEKEIKSQEKIMMASKMEYDDVKEQFLQHKDSKKGKGIFTFFSGVIRYIALEAVYISLKTELDQKKKKKKSKLKRLFTSNKSSKSKADNPIPKPPTLEMTKHNSELSNRANIELTSSVKHSSIKFKEVSISNK